MIWTLNELGLSAREAFAGRPHWEVQALLDERDEQIKEQQRQERKEAQSR